MFWTVCLGGLLIFLILEALRPDCQNRFKPGKFYYTKKWLFRLWLLLFCKKKPKDQNEGNVLRRRKRSYDRSSCDPVDPAQYDVCQPLEENPFAIDTVYFNGFDKDGTSLALRVARKHNREGELWLWLNVPGIGFFQHPIMPDAGVYNMEESGYRALGAKFQVIEPLRSWRVTYNGLLRKGLCNKFDNKPEEYVNVKMNFKWECFNDPFNFWEDMDKNMKADAVAREKWTKDFWSKFRSRKHCTQYEQCGELTGQIEIEGHDVRRVCLKSFRDHTFGVRNWEIFYRYAVHYIWIEEIGKMAAIAVYWMPDYITLLKTGFLAFASGETFPVTEVDLDLESITADNIPPEKYSFTFKAADELYKVDLVTMVTPEAYHYRGRTSRVLERFCTYTVNGRKARGLTEYHYRNPEGPAMGEVPKMVTLLNEPEITEEHKGQLTLTFQDKECQSSLLTGGKGSQLALLTSIQEQVGYMVPKGFCLTIAAFEQQIQENGDLESSLNKIVAAIRNEKLSELQQLCSNASQLLGNCKIVQPIESQLTSQLQKVFGESYEHIPLAVRSSAAGEDGGEASSAGQMETFLGVKGVDSLLEAVRKCWGSAYTYQAVEYRRQQGQPVRTSVAVVIQEMVCSDVSGVLFTNDPVTGNTNRMVIDASFGLGEAVVSGKVVPDTFIVQRLFDNTLNVLSRKLGEKNVEIRLADFGGVKEVKNGPASEYCLKDDQILQLCQLAVKVATHFGSARDIEWAIHKDQIHLLQARPITAVDLETDEDIIHEFDAPMPTGQERITLGNVGEMLPGVATPLTLSVFGRVVNIVISIDGRDFTGRKISQNSIKAILSCCGRIFFNMTFHSSLTIGSHLYNKDLMEYVVLGNTLDDYPESIIRTYSKQIKPSLMQTLKCFHLYNKRMKVLDDWHGKLKTYTIGADCQTALELYQAVDKQLPDYFEVWMGCLTKTARSSQYNGLVMGVLSGGKNAWTIDNYSDLASLLSQCDNVCSADVPVAIGKIVKTIVSMGKEKEVLEKSDTKAVQYLSSESCPTEIQQLYEDFMKMHGHRCIREAEFSEKPWRVEPEKLIRMLKTVLRSSEGEETKKSVPSISEAVNQLKSPVSSFGKFLLRKWIVKKARHAVGQREFGKSVAIDMGDRFKQAYWRLANFLYQEGRIPEKELIFCLTHSEIGELIETRSAKLIARARRRAKILPVLAKMEFPKVCVGVPQPILLNESDENRKATFTLTGVPVSVGKVKGTARVVREFENAGQIQRGDILIACYTDVGWSPYFPLISGLVIEMGGMLSHGAVVAREYGLPCVVDVPGATQTLRSGDCVELDGTNGCIRRLEELDN